MADTKVESNSEDQYTNMIRSASQGLASAIGGADIIIVNPADQMDTTGGTDFTNRIARNVQHILQMESHLNRVVDPAGGSYYVEKMTTAIAEEAWRIFLELEYR